jgi:hypothetical protein
MWACGFRGEAVAKDAIGYFEEVDASAKKGFRSTEEIDTINKILQDQKDPVWPDPPRAREFQADH